MSAEGVEVVADMNDDVSVSESSWADAQADTPTMGEGGSDSEDTLSNLSFDNDPEFGVDGVGRAAPGDDRAGSTKQQQQPSGSSTNNANVRVRINDFEMEEDSLHLNLPPGTTYKPPSVDFPTSPSQLKITKGPSFMPTEEPGVISEDESSVNSYRAHLGSNGDVRLTKRDDENQSLRSPPTGPYPQVAPVPKFELTLEGEPESLQIEDQDAFDDYMEDFFIPLSNEPVMQRATSFRRKVQKQFEDAYTEKSIREINNLEAMLSDYDDCEAASLTPEQQNFPVNSSTPNNCSCAHAKCNCVKGSVVNGSAIEMESAANGGSIHSSANSGGVRDSDNNTPPHKPDLYDPVFSMKRNEMDQQRKVTYGRGNEAFKDRRFKNKVKKALNFEDEDDEEPQSLLDIDAIVRANAPNLMNSIEPQSLQILHNQEEETSSIFLTKETLNKIESVFDSTNFNNLYTLSGELKHILTPTEIDEIIANKEQLATVLEPGVMAALMSWSLNDTSLPPHNLEDMEDHTQSFNLRNSLISNDAGVNDSGLPVIIETNSNKDDGSNNCFSSTTSLSNGFHSKESSLTDVSDQNELDEAHAKNNRGTRKTVPVKDSYSEEDESSKSGDPHNGGTPEGGFQRGTPMTASLRRKISLGKGIRRSDIPQKYVEVEEPSGKESKNSSSDSQDTVWRSLESLDDLGVVEDDVTSGGQGSEDGDGDAPKMILVRRDSKRYAKGDGSRIIQGLFIESKGTHSKGTLRKIRVPLNFDECTDASGDTATPVSDDDQSDAKTPKSHKKKITVDDHILSTTSEVDDNSRATDVTQSDVFHSIINSPLDEDRTIRSDLDADDEDITLDIDTPDDMEESILEQLESIATTPVSDRIPELTAEEELEDERRWKSFRVGANDIHIDLKAIQPYRRVLSHGGYFDAEKKVAIILFSGCFLPDRNRKEYSYLMDHLFLYVLSSLEELIVEDYILVYLHGATPKSCVPTFNWLKRCYQLIDHRLRKNLKGLYLVHPSFWLKTVVALTKPFVSAKFSRKLQFVNTLADLCLLIPTEHLVIPDRVLHYDFELKLEDLRRQNKLS